MQKNVRCDFSHWRRRVRDNTLATSGRPSLEEPMTDPTALPSFSDLVYRKERLYYGVMLFISVIVYGVLAYVIVQQPALLAPILMYGVVGALAFLFVHG